MEALMIQGKISSKILTLRGQQVMLDRPSTSSGTDHWTSLVTELCRSAGTEHSISLVTELCRSAGTDHLISLVTDLPRYI